MAVGRVIPIFRAAVLGLTSIFLIVVLGLSAHLITIRGSGVVRDVEGLGVAVAVLSLLSVVPFLVMSLFTRGSFFNWNIIELPILAFILILWLAESALAAQWTALFYPSGCADVYVLSNLDKTYCNELYAVEGLSFVVWIALLAYIITNLVFSILGQQRGNRVWKISVQEATYLERNNDAGEKEMQQPSPVVSGGPQYTAGGQQQPQYTQQPQFSQQQPQYSHTQPQPQYTQPGATYSPVPPQSAQV